MLSRFMWMTLLPFLTAASTAETEPLQSVLAPYPIERRKPLVQNILDELSKDPIFKKFIDKGNEYRLLSSVLKRNECTVDQFGRLLCFMIDNEDTNLGTYERLGDFARVHIMGMIGARVHTLTIYF